ncbi:GNAT family N-acetyltransferase [Deinococcus altitudinis]|uniref:GNAT family N-acetyltransferase n=1 Tax=Deinococcus altitudinis TaxID=468914 RepID=UPI003891FC4A
MNEPTVSDARPADAPALARLLTDAYLGQWVYPPEHVARRLDTPRPGRFTLSARRGEQLLAGLNADPFGSVPGGLRVQLYGDASAFTPLYLETLTRAARLGYRSLLSVVRHDHRPQVEFLGAAGFRNAYQSWGAHLQLQGFDFTPYRQLEERHYLEGTEVHSYTPESPDAPWDALHRLYADALKDTPRNPTTTHESDSSEYFRAEVASGRVFAAVRRGEVMSYTALGLNEASVESHHTATRAASRGRGLATLIKATALNWAREQGHLRASTGGNVANLPMLRVNQSLGYLPEPMWLTWVRDLPSPALAPATPATSPA